MRRLFAEELLKEAKENKNIILLTGDLGYGVWDTFRQELPEQFINCGASEQAMMDIAVGLAYAGKIPFVYSITPFLLFRPFETLRTYINHEKLPVKLIGGGRNNDYSHDGFSHDATDALRVLECLPNIVRYFPDTNEDVKKALNEAINNKKATFISLRRAL